MLHAASSSRLTAKKKNDIDSEDFTPNGTMPFRCGSRNFSLELQSASIHGHIV